VTYVLEGDIHRLRIPSVRTPRRVVGLWRRTCFEAFVGMHDCPAYYEFNFSPSGEWAAYAFHGYREGEPIEDDGLAPETAVRCAVDKVEIDTAIRLDRLPEIQPGTILRIGLSAVIEAIDGTLSYWALRHSSDKPDFHHPESFVLELTLPGHRA
jgi:hypothetical protein